MTIKKTLSNRQDSILDFIHHFVDTNQFPPSVRDIQAGCNISSTSVVDYNLQILQREGFLRRRPEISRGIELLYENDSSENIDLISIPVLGTIAAGKPLEVLSPDSWQEEPLETVDLPPFLVQNKSDVYALRVKGSSMVDALVGDGDLVLMEPINQPENGDMVAAWLTDSEEVTLKKFFLEGRNVRLQPANTTMAAITVPASKVAVKGRVVGVVRTL